MGPGAHKARALIENASQLDLQAAFLRPGAEAEDFEDQARAVDDLSAKTLFQVALLDRRQRAVDDGNGATVRIKVLGHAVENTAREEVG